MFSVDAYCTNVSLHISQIFSNANEAHVAEVLGRLGLEDCFDDVICFESLNSNSQTTDVPKSFVIGDNNNEPVGLLPKTPIVCKPSENAFQQAFKMAKINPDKTVSFLKLNCIMDLYAYSLHYLVESHNYYNLWCFSCSLMTAYATFRLQNSRASPLYW